MRIDRGGRVRLRITSRDDLESLLEKLSPDEIATYGLVLESDLREVTTLSIGQIVLDAITVTYHGMQRVVVDNNGRSAYGGSDLICVRGGWEALDQLSMSAEVRRGVTQAKLYDEAMREYPGFMVSRRNYDVGQGMGAKGQRRSGVLEGSWRIGKASPAELVALKTFKHAPELTVVAAAHVEEFGKDREGPPSAIIHFQGDDAEVDPILRYTVLVRR